MAWHTEPAALELDDVVARIVEAIRPWRIVLFGSRARGTPREDSDFDLYVEVDHTTASLREVHDQIRSMVRGGLTYDLKVHARGTIEERRDDPGTIEWDVAREGRILYADPAAPNTVGLRRQVGEPSRKLPESLQEWLDAAARDVRAAELLTVDNSLAPMICWLSHQMCEKYMKALLVSRRIRPERTHNLEDLLAALRGAGCLLAGLDDECQLLTGHSTKPRYPAGNLLGVEDARRASEAATRVVAAVRAVLPPSVL